MRMFFLLTETHSTAGPLTFVFMVIFAVFWWWWQRDACREEIHREARRWKARVVRIEWLPCHTMNENDTLSAHAPVQPPAEPQSIVADCAHCGKDDQQLQADPTSPPGFNDMKK